MVIRLLKEEDMKAREIKPGIDWVGAVDWNRRLFDRGFYAEKLLRAS